MHVIREGGDDGVKQPFYQTPNTSAWDNCVIAGGLNLRSGMYVWQSRIEIKYYFIAYFECITKWKLSTMACQTWWCARNTRWNNIRFLFGTATCVFVCNEFTVEICEPQSFQLSNRPGNNVYIPYWHVCSLIMKLRELSQCLHHP